LIDIFPINPYFGGLGLFFDFGFWWKLCSGGRHVVVIVAHLTDVSVLALGKPIMDIWLLGW
jgi:hypothetical protein